MYRNTIKPSTFFIDLLLVFLKKHIIWNHTNLAKKYVYWKNIDFLKNINFLKNCQLNLHENVLKRRYVQKYNKTKHFFH